MSSPGGLDGPNCAAARQCLALGGPLRLALAPPPDRCLRPPIIAVPLTLTNRSRLHLAPPAPLVSVPLLSRRFQRFSC